MFFFISCIIMPATAANSTVTPTTTILLSPVASFSGSPTFGIAPSTVQFTDTSSNSPKLWRWNFGDGNTSTVQNPVNTYATAGTYTVTLIATNAVGSNTATRTSYITVIGVPGASFSGNPTSGTAPLMVQFTDTSTNSPTSWSWNFGDGNTSTVQNPVNNYATAGTYTVSLIATNAAGSNSATQTGYITVSGVPGASFSGSPTSGTAPFTVRFTDTSANSPTSWSWNFGDGGTSTEQNPSHTYTNTGTYTVSLTTENSAGSSGATRSDYILVGTATDTEATVVTSMTPTILPTFPDISFSGTPTSGPAPLTVQFSMSTSGTPTSILWDFGDGGTSTDHNPSYTYVIPGTYTVILTATYPEGRKPVTKSSYIIVNTGSTSSPLSPLVPIGAIGIITVVSFVMSGRKRH